MTQSRVSRLCEVDRLQPMVVYASKNVYANWIGGPMGTKFSFTSSGWFNSSSFQE